MNVSTPTTTRSGRLVKKPERYEPSEKVEDDYASDEYDTDDDSDSDVPSVHSSEEDEESDSESEGSLKDFVVPDESESETETDDE